EATRGRSRAMGAADDGGGVRAGHGIAEDVMWRDVWHDLRYRIRAFTHREAAECDLDAEIKDHLAREAEALERSGLSPADARREARLAFGGLEGTRERTRDAWGTSFIDSIVQDVRYAIRGLSAPPAF